MTYSGVNTYKKKYSEKPKPKNADSFHDLLNDGKTIVLKWKRVLTAWIGLFKRTSVLARKSIRLMFRDRTACLKRVSIAWTKNGWAWVVLAAATIRRMAESFWLVVRILLWLIRLFTAPPQQIGPVSAYRKRNTGLALPALEMSLLVFAGLMIAGTLL